MINTNTLLVFLITTAIGWAATPEKSTVYFTNGDSLKGSIVSLQNNQLSWNSDTLGGEAKVQIEKIREILLSDVAEMKAEGDHMAFVHFNPDLRQQNQKMAGDTIYGSLVDITEKHVVLDTWYAGRLQLDRNMIRSFDISDKKAFFYSGPKLENDWTFSPSKSWENQNGFLDQKSANGTASRMFDDLPEAFCLSLKAESESRLSFQIIFCTEKASSRSDGYLMTVDPNYCYLQRFSDNNGGILQGNERNQSPLREKEQTTLELYVDRKTGKIALYSDKELVQEWSDPGQKPVGKAISFSSAGRSNDLKISKIQLSYWNGKLPNEKPPKPDPITNPDPDPAKGEQRIYLRNGDIALGSYQKIASGKIMLSTRFGEMELPIARIKKMDIPPVEYNERLLQNGDIRCWFPDGNYVTFRVEEITQDGKYKGRAQHFGEATFDPTAFNRIEFNLYPVYKKTP